MTASTARDAYIDCFKLLDRALDRPNGIRVSLPDRGAAMQLRTKLHFARTLDRRDKEKIYPIDDPQWGVSVYDPLIVRVREEEGKFWVYIEPRTIVGEIEDLPGAAE